MSVVSVRSYLLNILLFFEQADVAFLVKSVFEYGY